jgi:hypothetical protein
MEIPLHEQLRNHQWRQMITAAGPDDLEALRTAALLILDYAISSRGFALQQAAALLPRQQEAPAE